MHGGFAFRNENLLGSRNNQFFNNNTQIFLYVVQLHVNGTLVTLCNSFKRGRNPKNLFTKNKQINGLRWKVANLIYLYTSAIKRLNRKYPRIYMEKIVVPLRKDMYHLTQGYSQLYQVAQRQGKWKDKWISTNIVKSVVNRSWPVFNQCRPHDV